MNTTARQRILGLLVGSIVAICLVCLPTPALADGSSADKDDKADKEQAEQAETRATSPYAAATHEREQSEEDKVFTNEDLERLAAGYPNLPSAASTTAAEPTPPTAAAKEAKEAKEANETKEAPASEASAKEAAKEAIDPIADPLGALKQQQEQAAARRQAITETEVQISTLEQQIEAVQRRALAVKNPLLGRQYGGRPPEEGEEGHEEWSGQTAPQRVQSADSELARLRQELSEAQRRLADLRAGR